MIEEFGKHFSCFYIAEDVKAGKPETEFRVAASKGHFQGQGWRVRKNGSRFWANVAMTAVRDGSGSLVGYGVITRELEGAHCRASGESSCLHQAAQRTRTRGGIAGGAEPARQQKLDLFGVGYPRFPQGVGTGRQLPPWNRASAESGQGRRRAG